ncbi:MAG: hypothetical protein WA820_02520 [Bradyrhizobium sp.]|jgi:hypothetical protein
MSFTVTARGHKPKPPISLHRYMYRACWDIDHIQIETANEQPVLIRGAGEKLVLIARSKWSFDSWRVDDRHLAARSGAC